MFFGPSMNLGSTPAANRQQAFALANEATILNDLTPTSTPATNAVDPFTGEPCLQNLLLRSQEFDNASWQKLGGVPPTVSANATTAPDGTLTADRVTFGATGIGNRILQDSAALASGGTAWTGSVWMRANTPCTIRLNVERSGPADTESVVCSVTQNWQRFTLAHSTTWTGATAVRLSINDISAPGDVDMWGAQLVQGSVAGRYAPTTTAAALPRRRRPLLVAGRTVQADLVEGSRTNLCLRSQEFNTTWTLTSGILAFGAGSVVDATAAPDGTVTADLLTEDTSTGTHRVVQSTIPATLNTAITISLYVKSNGRDRVTIYAMNSAATGNFFTTTINLTTGAAELSSAGGNGSVTSASAVSVGNGWYRIIATGIADSTVGVGNARYEIRLNNGGTSYTGDGVSGAYLWGAQLEQAAFPSTYIPTAGATVTRGADSLSVSLASLPGGGLSTTAGTILALAVPEGWTGDQDGTSVWCVAAGDVTTRFLIERTGATTLQFRRDDAGVNNLLVTHGMQNRAVKAVGCVYDAVSVRAFIDGAAAGTPDTSLTPPYTAVTGMNIGQSVGAIRHVHGWVALLYWPRALTAAEIAVISQESGLAGAALL